MNFPKVIFVFAQLFLIPALCAQTLIMETGNVTISHVITTVTLNNTFIDPVVIATPPGNNGGDEAAVRLRNITGTSFQLFIDEADGLDGSHTTEVVHYVVIEKGVYTFPDGTQLEAGTTTSSNMSFQTVSLLQTYGATPTILTQVQTDNSNTNFLKTRQTNPSTASFQVKLERAESINSTSPSSSETIGYFAISKGTSSLDGITIEANSFTADENTQTYNFIGSFSGGLHFIASIATFNGGDPASIRRTNLTNSLVSLFLEEDISANSEQNHTNETVDFFAIDDNSGNGIYLPPAPGGAANDLQLWLKTDQGTSTTSDGSAINSWIDQSHQRTNDATSTNMAPPTFRNNSTDNMNFNPVLDFDGTNDGLNFGGDYFFADASKDGLEIFTVVKPDDAIGTKTRQFIFDFGYFANSGVGFGFGDEHYANYTPTNHSGVFVESPHSFSNSKVLLNYDVNFDNGGGGSQVLNVNANEVFNVVSNIPDLASSRINESATPAGTSGPITIGHQSKSAGLGSNSGRLFDGKLAEIIVYNNDISSPTDKSKIQSYLALKYGITLDNSTGGTAGDYLLSDGTIAWDASNITVCHNQIIGLVKDDASGLLQKQSKTDDDSLTVYIGNLATTNQANSGTISNNESSIIIGHNNGFYKSNPATYAEIPTGIVYRFDREWKVTNTNFSDDFSIEFEWAEVGTFNINDIRLLVDTDGNFTNATVYGAPDVTITQGSIIVSGINNSIIPINSTRFITIGSVSVSTPLPIELIEFNAKANENNTVEISWLTKTEIDNDYFTIERSNNGKQWKNIKEIKGAGSSSTEQLYKTEDFYPHEGLSYYRLKQTDFDGNHKYFQARSVNINVVNKTELLIYPNPSEDKITIQSNKYPLEKVTIYNILGQDVSSKAKVLTETNSEIVISLSNLERGIYYIRTNTSTHKVYKR